MRTAIPSPVCFLFFSTMIVAGTAVGGYCQTVIDIEESFQTAQQAAFEGDFSTAITALERVLILDPTLDNIRLELGVLHLRVGNTDAAEVLIREAIKAPDTPPDVRARAQELLQEAVLANRRLKFGGSFAFGLISDSNANSGPVSNALGPGFVISPESTASSDISAFLLGDLKIRYDLGFQSRHLFAVDTGLYWRSYQEQSNLSLVAPSIAIGLDLNATKILDRPADILLRWNERGLWRDGDDFLSESGPTATLRFSPGPSDYSEISVGSVQQDYKATDAFPTNDMRDGRRDYASFVYSRSISSQTSLSFGAGYSSKTAVEGFEAFDEKYLSLGIQHSFESPIGNHSALLAGLNVRRSWIDYEQPDPAIDMNTSQSDNRWSISANLTIPLYDRVSLVTELGYVDQSSNYAIDSYDNTYALIMISRQF